MKRIFVFSIGLLLIAMGGLNAYTFKVTAPQSGTYIAGEPLRVEWECDLCPSVLTIYLMRSSRIVMKIAEISYLAGPFTTKKIRLFSYTFPLPLNLSSGYGYYIKLVSQDGRSAESPYFTVKVPLPPQIHYFQAKPSSIFKGESSNLSWSISDATLAKIEPGIGGVDPQRGTVTVRPSRTTTYVLTAEGPGGTSSRQVTVYVKREALPKKPVKKASTLKIYNPGPIRLHIDLNKGKAFVYFTGNHVFTMEAKRVRLKGFGPKAIVALIGDTGIRVFLNVKTGRIFYKERDKRKIWVEGIRIKGTGPVFDAVIKNKKAPIEIHINFPNKIAYMFWGEKKLFTMMVKLPTATPGLGLNRGVELRGNGRIPMYINFPSREIMFHTGKPGRWSKFSL